MPTVILADDHIVVRQALKGLLEREKIQVVGEAADGQDVTSLAGKLTPDVAVIDIVMPILNGIEAAREIRKASPKTRVILLTGHDEEQYVAAALQAGIKGYVLKHQALTDLVQAIHQVCGGKFYLSPGLSRTVVDAFLSKDAAATDPLSPRERQVVQLVAEGKSTKEVAILLGISPKTAESHRTRLMYKLDIHETAGLVRYAVRRGIVEA